MVQPTEWIKGFEVLELHLFPMTRGFLFLNLVSKPQKQLKGILILFSSLVLNKTSQMYESFSGKEVKTVADFHSALEMPKTYGFFLLFFFCEPIT